MSAPATRQADGRLDVVEPTLASEAGHCGLLLRSLHAAAPALAITVWAGKGSQRLFADLGSVELVGHFSRRWRKLQAYFLYRRLLRAGGPILVPTAGRFDLEAIARAAAGPVGPNRVFLYFHRLALSPTKARALRRIARRQPNLVTIGTTRAIEARLRDLGFEATGVMLPMPPRPPAAATGGAAAEPFRRVVVAGAARADKGFHHAVALVEAILRRQLQMPIALQVSGDHYARHDPVTRSALRRLAHVHSPLVATLPQTLDAPGFADLLRGGICLQPYEPDEYADKISAITLDALNAGSPIVTVDGTWMADIARRFGCGEVAASNDPDELLAALERVRRDYATYARRALAAAAELDAEERWQPLLSRLGLEGRSST
ncbi:MAG TPA: hypothetical protein VMU33_12710 [Burkholderiaceae bacterium]|nr:hypothetical protein [Burkholderiaceae bacterium]